MKNNLIRINKTDGDITPSSIAPRTREVRINGENKEEREKVGRSTEADHLGSPTISCSLWSNFICRSPSWPEVFLRPSLSSFPRLRLSLLTFLSFLSTFLSFFLSSSSTPKE